MSGRDDRTSWIADTLGNRPFIVAALYLGCFFLPMLIIVAVPLAFIFRREPAEEWEASHYSYQVRTFLLALGLCILLVALFVAGLMIFGETDSVAIPTLIVFLPVSLAAMAQFGVRSVLSMARAVARQPMPRPDTLLF
jgi:uncharacterized membrane protein